MKFNKERWRTLAENKPDELHSYIPQSSISELFDEIERLEHEIAKCKEANKDVQSRLDDYRQDYAKVVNDLCPTDERHCGCVPILRRENRLISEELAEAKDELKHRRDALIDAQRIYNEANNHKMRWISVSERLPENGQDVFCISKYGEGKARQFMDDGETKWWMHSDSVHCDELDFIVKWMPVIQEEG